MSVDKVARSKIDSKFTHSDYVRESILDAAQRCYQKKTIGKVRLVDIAAEAKRSRATVYRYFDNRDEVLIRVVLRRLQWLLCDMENRLENIESFAEFTVETMAIILDEIPKDHLLSIIFLVVISKEGDEISISSTLKKHFHTRFEAARLAGVLCDELEFEQLMNWILRVLLSYTSTSSRRPSPFDFRKMLWQFFVPSLIR